MYPIEESTFCQTSLNMWGTPWENHLNPMVYGLILSIDMDYFGVFIYFQTNPNRVDLSALKQKANHRRLTEYDQAH